MYHINLLAFTKLNTVCVLCGLCVGDYFPQSGVLTEGASQPESLMTYMHLYRTLRIFAHVHCSAGIIQRHMFMSES
jgi:hypothetical protein